MSLAEQRWLRLLTLCLFYVAQGIPWGFTAVTIPSYLASQHVEVGTTLAMTTLPYSFKWVWGPIIDRWTWARFGRRRPWIVFAQLMMAATILAMIVIPDLATDLRLLAWMILLHTVFNGLQDVAVDALAVDLLEEEERGRANGFMYASKYAGGAIGGAGVGTLVEAYGFDVALIGQTIVLVGIMAILLVVRERSAPVTQAEPRATMRDVLGGLVRAFSVRSTLVGAVLAIVIQISIGLLSAASFALYTQQLGWSPAAYARFSGLWVLIPGGLGAVTGGLLADLVGHRRLAAIASVAMAACWIGFSFVRPWWTEDLVVYSFGVLYAFCQGALSAALFAVFMDLCVPRVAASQYTAYMALLNYSTTIGYMASAWATATWEFEGMLLVIAGFQLGVTPLLLLVDPREVRAKAEQPAGVMGAIGLVGLALFLVGATAYITWRTLG